MIRRLSLATFVLFAAACSDEPRQAAADGKPGSFVEKGAFSPLYAEEVKDGRIYVFGTAPMHDAFVKTQDVEITKFKTYIGIGPNHETVIVQVDKEDPIMARRLLARFHERWPAAAPTQPPVAAAANAGGYK